MTPRWPLRDVVTSTHSPTCSSPRIRTSPASPTACARPGDADDAAQDALWILYRRLGTLRAGAALAGWTFQIIKHECIRRARRRSVEPLVDRAAADDPERAVLHRMEVQRVASALAALAPEHREIIVLRDLEGRDAHETADLLGISVPAVKSRLHRARAALRQSLTIE